MDTEGLQALRAEVQLAGPPLAAIVEGLRHDLEQQDLQPEDRAEVQALLADYERRESLLISVETRTRAAFEAVVALENDGYPNLPEREIDPGTFEALDQNRRSIEAAQAQFRPRAITTEGTSTVGPEERSHKP